MKIIKFTIKNEPKIKIDSRYNFTDDERDKYISEISEKLRKAAIIRDIMEIQSIEEASKFYC
jgi:hypothetical protein